MASGSTVTVGSRSVFRATAGVRFVTAVDVPLDTPPPLARTNPCQHSDACQEAQQIFQ